MIQISDLIGSSSEDYLCSLSFENIYANVYSNEKDILEYIKLFLFPYFRSNIPSPKASLFDLTCILNVDICNIYDKYFSERTHILLRDSENDESKYHGEINTIDENKFIRTEDSLIIFCANSKKIIVVSKNVYSLKKYSRLIIRDIVQKAYEKEKGTVFHGSSVIMNDNESIIGILGEKGAGKTTILFDYLFRKKYKKHSLDRLFINSENEDIYAVGWPTLLNIGIGTLSRYTEMEHLMPKKYRDIKNPEEFWYIKEKLALEPMDLPFYSDIGRGKLKYLIFPIKNQACIDSKVIKMDSQMIKSELKKHCFSPKDPNFIDWHRYIKYDEEIIIKNADELIDRICLNIPCLYLEWGEKINLPF
ncbi:MAG: hypothetical protein FIA99_15180 [Ruminiclostridium sp.]|nr:hypothetical protein [Ruminiclostridium sp.]